MAKLTNSEARDRLYWACKAAGSQKAWGAENGFSQSTISNAIMGRKRLSDRMLGCLGLRRIAPTPTDTAA
jgi:hypothetical protein